MKNKLLVTSAFLFLFLRTSPLLAAPAASSPTPPANNYSLSGHDALDFAQILADHGVGANADAVKFVKQTYDAKNCAGDNKWKQVIAMFKVGQIRCRIGSASWDNECTILARDGKKHSTVQGTQAYAITKYLITAGVKGTPGDHDGTIYSAPSYDCEFHGWAVCQGKATCSFP